MRDVERGRRDHGVVHAEESAGTPGRTTNVSDHAAARNGGAPYTTATIVGDCPPWSSDRPTRVDLTPSLSSAPAPAPAVKPSGPGLTEVEKRYAPYGAGDGIGDPGLVADVARIVEEYPEEKAAIFAYVDQRDGADAGKAVLAAIDKNKHRKKGVTIKGAALDLDNPLLPTIGFPGWAGGVSQERDNPEAARIAQSKRQDARDAQARGETTPNPIVDGLNRMRNGPQKEGPDAKRNGKKLDDALEDERNRKRDGGMPDAGTPDAGSPPESRKRIDD